MRARVDAREALGDPAVTSAACLRLVLLFALRYEKEGERQITELQSALAKRNVEPAFVRLVRDVTRVAGEARRVGDLFGNRTFSRAQKAVSGLKGADNVYTQHQPLLVQTLENISKERSKGGATTRSWGRPRTRTPRPGTSAGGDFSCSSSAGSRTREARFVAQMNDQPGDADRARRDRHTELRGVPHGSHEGHAVGSAGGKRVRRCSSMFVDVSR